VPDLVLPPGVERSLVKRPEQFPAPGRGVILNESDLPDEVVQTYIEENASLMGLSPGNSYQTYAAAGAGNLMTRPKWKPPSNLIEEIVMARELADRDDDVAATIGAMTALAFGEGLQHSHRDEVTVAMFDEIAEKAQVALKFKEMYREWLIAHQVTTAVVFRREQVSFVPMGADRQRSRNAVIPMVAILPAEQIRVTGNDIFGNAKLAYRPFSGRQEQWLQEYFSNRTTPARKQEMRREDPILTTLLTEQVAWDPMLEGSAQWVYSDPLDPIVGSYVYTLNPELVKRVTGPKGQWQNPRPMMTRNMPLLEAKRLLTIMDYTLLEAGANFLLVVKKGSDNRPALPEEITNLRETIMRASRSGVLIGDHRVDVEVITPKLDELLNPDKRKLIGRKLAAALLRIPDIGTTETGAGQEVLTSTEILSRVIASDRHDLTGHMKRSVYELTAQRNDLGTPGVWFPRIVLQGLQFFQDLLLGLRDRGDIPRKYVVEAAGFDWTSAVEQRRLEKSSGDDKVMTPAAVPFSSPDAGPQDRGGGRPPGAKTDQATPRAPGSGKRTVQKNAGETIKAEWEGSDGPIYRFGELTYGILETYPDRTIGRITRDERSALATVGSDHDGAPVVQGGVIVVPVNLEYAIEDVKAVRLTRGMSVLVGNRDFDDAVVTRALVFRKSEFSEVDAEEWAMRWGFENPAADE
jgi:hypothetical protein